MGKTLTRDEKKYIIETLKKKVTDFLVNINLYDLKCAKVVKYIESTQTYKDLIPPIKTICIVCGTIFDEKKFKLTRVYAPYDNVEFGYGDNNTNIDLKFVLDLPKNLIDELKALDTKYNALYDYRHCYNDSNLNLEKWFILFSTWKVKPEERLLKVDELIEMIYKELTK